MKCFDAPMHHLIAWLPGRASWTAAGRDRRVARVCGRRRGALAGLLLALAAIASAAKGQGYPSRPITLIVPAAAGGIVDLAARIVGNGLTQKYKQPVIVVNKGAGNGNPAIAEFVKAAPDGYTLLVSNDGGVPIHAAVDPNFTFDPVRDFVPIAIPMTYSHLFMVPKSIPVASVKDFVAYVKANAGKLTYGSAGYGSLQHIISEIFAQQAGLKMIHVPYRGIAPATNDLLAGNISMLVQNVPSATSTLDSGRVRVLAAFDAQRNPDRSTVPTMAELGYPEVTVKSWIGVWGPRGLPAAIRQQLSEAIGEIVALPQSQERYRTVGAGREFTGAAAFEPFYLREVSRWKSLVTERHIKITE
jgi:tripartite-type tricarboxylate transporter receptor subunit TctC